MVMKALPTMTGIDPEITRALVSERNRLLREVASQDRKTSALAESGRTETGDIVDLTANLDEQRLVGMLSNMARARLADIDAALARILKGDYGDCDECHQPIETDRLRALPWARRCMACQRWIERRAR